MLPYEFGKFFSVSMKNAIEILVGFVLNLFITLGNMEILRILILIIHEHGLSFHLFYISSINIMVLVYRTFTYFAYIYFLHLYLFYLFLHFVLLMLL